jgi:predicted LPLAT superfamily acyltransferase
MSVHRTSAQQSAQHWASIGESTFAGGMWLLGWVYRLFGRLPFRICVYPVVFYYWAAKPLARRASAEYLQRMQAAHGVFETDPGVRTSLRHFAAFAETILDKTLALSGRYPARHIHLDVCDELAEALHSKRGGLFVTAHVGCVELSQFLASAHPELHLTVLVHTAHAEQFTRMMRRLNPLSTITFIQVTDVSADTAIMLSERVERGEFVAIVGDRVPVSGARHAPAQFLRHEAPFPIGPYILGSLLKCPVFMLTCLRDHKSGHTLRCALLGEQIVLPRGQREAALAQWTQRYASELEGLLRRAPLDWFNFFDFWNQGSAGLPPSPHRSPP